MLSNPKASDAFKEQFAIFVGASVLTQETGISAADLQPTTESEQDADRQAMSELDTIFAPGLNDNPISDDDFEAIRNE